MDLSVITVTWNVEERIAEQIRSVSSGCKKISCEEIIIDNGSTDGTCDIVRTFPHVHLIENKKNLGFSAANNIGLAKAKGEFLLFLNPDMRVLPESLDTIVSWMRQHPEVGIASPKLIDEHGEINREAGPRRFPRMWEQIAIMLKAPHFFPKMLHGYHMRDFNPEKEQQVDSVRGSFMIMRREFLDKTGWAFDPRYFIWYEDVDICREATKHGFQVIYTPVISCVDYVGQSFKKRKTLWKQKQFTKSMIQYAKKWEGPFFWMPLVCVRPLGIALAWLHDVLRKKV